MKTDYASLLNQAQLEAVTTSAPHVRIIAGAGSGKTRVLTYRIAYLIDEMNVDPQAILAVTFTNKAAREMQDRVARLVPNSAHFLQVSTFHSFCARFLRHEIHRLGYPTAFSIIDDDDQEKLIKEIGETLGFKKSDPILKEALHYIGYKKTMGLYPEDVYEKANPSLQEAYRHLRQNGLEQNSGALRYRFGSFLTEATTLLFYYFYEERKRAMLCLDFDDLMLMTTKILSDFPEVRDRWSARFEHILVDEFQDTNDVQYNLMRMLSRPDTNIYVVGDPDQTIYTWRGANQKIILNFPIVYPDYIDIVLDRNYRSTKKILNGANRLIAYNKKRVPKNLYTEGAEGSPITCKRFETAQEEADFIAREITRLSEACHPARYDNIAVLYRSSFLTRPLESSFAASGIPYRVFGGLRFYQRKEVKDVLAYFRLLINPLDDVAFTRIYNVPKRGIGDASFNLLKEEAEENGLSLYNYVAQLGQLPTDLPTRVVTKLILLSTQIEEVKKKLTENLETYGSVLRSFITDIGYYEYIAEDQGIDEDRAENVNALFDDINAYISKNPESSFEEYLQNIALLTSQDDMNGGNYVSLMTVHVAKGLEFDNVFVMGLNQGTFPSARSIADTGRDGLEEERRLAYVAFTRAKQNLFLTTNSGYSYVSGSKQVPSQFFEEAGFAFPKESTFASVYPGGYAPRREGKSSWKTVRFGQSSDDMFGDGDHFDPFAKEEPKEEPKPKDNGIRDWHVGDRLHHEKFGDGTVKTLIDSSIFVVVFDDGATRTMVSTHPLISRLTKPGGVA